MSRFEVTSMEVCEPGMNRLRSPSEMTLTARVHVGAASDYYLAQWLSHLKVSWSGRDFDAIKPAVVEWWVLHMQVFGLVGKIEDGLCAYLYVRDNGVSLSDLLTEWRADIPSDVPALKHFERLRLALGEVASPMVSIDPRGRNVLEVTLDLKEPGRGIPAGPAVRVYLNDYGSREANPAREELAQAVARFIGEWLEAGQ